MDKIEIASLDYLRSRNLIKLHLLKIVRSEQIEDTFRGLLLFTKSMALSGIILNVSNLLTAGIFLEDL